MVEEEDERKREVEEEDERTREVEVEVSEKTRRRSEGMENGDDARCGLAWF